MEKILVKNSQKDILELCKSNNVLEEDDSLKFIELTRDMYKDQPEILKKYFRNEFGYSCYYPNILSLQGLNIYQIKKVLKNDFGKSVSLKGYKYNPDHYRFFNEDFQEEYEEDLFKDKSDEDEEIEYEAYRRKAIEPIDFEAMDTLYAVLFKALKSRLVMILNLESVPGLINNALDCYYKSVSCGPSNNAMNAKISELRAKLEDPEVIMWLKTKPTDLMFDKYDYIYTYQKVLRQLTGIRDENLEYCRDLIDNSEDFYQEEILANEYLDTEYYSENSLDDEDDYLD